ncbi:YceI family protein [Pedobacter nyackensis]|uniref:YceI family protein n=1 Tax=Pedobacter nyackensis TaxID=475255 RepID=UPI002930F5E7|nr:YceI family protein [Pedobacter nyackensis]
MRKISLIAITMVVFATSAFALVSALNWQIKENAYSVKFSTSRAEGVIKGLVGSIEFDEKNLSVSNFDVTVDVTSLNTGNGLKNRHAKGEKFLNASKYPIIHFKSSQITQNSTGYIAKGKLTIKDISQDVSIPFTFSKTGNEAVFSGDFVINRKDFKLDFKGIGEVIRIELLIPVSK